MSDKQTIEAIEKKNEERAPETLAEFAHRADIDFLLSEIEARDAEIENLQDGNVGRWKAHAERNIERADLLYAELQRANAEIQRLRAEIAVDDKLLAERNRILEAHPCPVHGPCVPYVLNTIKRQDGDCDE